MFSRVAGMRLQTLLFLLLVTFLAADDEPARVTGRLDGGIQINRGTEDGVTAGLEGVVFFKARVEGKDFSISLARNRIKAFEGKSIETKPGTSVTQEAFGWLEIVANPWAEVEIDGRVIGEVPPVKEEKVSAGKHQVRVTMGSISSQYEVMAETGCKARLFFQANVAAGRIELARQEKEEKK